ncbi:alpha-glucosidase [Reticulomyxa filosa]|uniref:Alpha-glucosidase n=1 Tax=Reticulomyxa filosa TaxID=46433 RepID=X6MNK6_RETFI|nr:alpha-glucosidase [Reticulomyxa filosa]|eukprot:ETO15409.1 alpha-glucosidase [Reticulomyxa filosa]
MYWPLLLSFFCACATSFASFQVYSLSNFQLNYSLSGETLLSIYHNDQPNYAVFSVARYYDEAFPFLVLGYAGLIEAPIESGNYQYVHTYPYEYVYNSSDEIAVSKIESGCYDNDVYQCVLLYGQCIFSELEQWNVSFVWNISVAKLTAPYLHSSDLYATKDALDFSIEWTAAAMDEVNRAWFTYDSDPGEAIMGLGGVQYSYFNMKGKVIPIINSEQGVGRGLEPLTATLNIEQDKAGGAWYTTYGSVPGYISNRNRSMVLYNYECMIFDLESDATAIRTELFSNETNVLSGRVIYGASPQQQIEQMTLVTGRSEPLPRWSLEGGILGIEGGQTFVMNTTLSLLTQYNRTKLVGVWMQDWVGTVSNGVGGQRLLWNWELNTIQYPDWSTLVDEFASRGVRVLTYINPYFANVTANMSSNGFQHNYFDEGVRNGFFVRAPDTNDTYLINSFSIQFACVDLTNPKAVQWIQTIIQQNMLNATNVSGFMADFGEYLPLDAVLYDSSSVSGQAYHNYFAQRWAQVVREAIDNYSVFPKYARTHWLGDQLVSWDVYDGLQSVLFGIFSGGVIGHSCVHSDIGGYTMLDQKIKDTNIDIPFLTYLRSQQLLLRWMELSAFSDCIFRSHPGNLPNLSYQVYSNNVTKSHFEKFTNVFYQLSQYKYDYLQNQSYLYGYPLSQHLYLQYWNDPFVQSAAFDTLDHHLQGNPPRDHVQQQNHIINTQLIVGNCLLIAPVVVENTYQRDVYLPVGQWTHWWTQRVFNVTTFGFF